MLQQGMCPLPKDPGVIGYCLILILPGTTDAQPHSSVPRWLSVGLPQLKPAAWTGLWGCWDCFMALGELLSLPSGTKFSCPDVSAQMGCLLLDRSLWLSDKPALPCR